MSDQNTSKYFNKIIRYLATRGQGKKYGYDDLLNELEIPQDYRDILLDKLWFSNPRYIDAEPALKNPQIMLNKEGINYADQLEESHFNETGFPFYSNPEKLIFSLQEGCEYIFQMHKNISYSVRWTKEIAREMPPTYNAAIEALKHENIIFEKNNTLPRITFLNAKVEDANSYNEALNIIQGKIENSSSNWMDDLYESPATDDISLVGKKEEIISAIIYEFDVRGSSKVRLRWVIEEKLKLNGYIYTSDLAEIFFAMTETGNYEGRPIKYKGMSDVLIWRKPWHERNRLLFGFLNSTIAQIATVLVVFIVGLLFGKSCN